MARFVAKALTVDAAQWDGTVTSMQYIEKLLGIETAYSLVHPDGRVVHWSIKTHRYAAMVSPQHFVVVDEFRHISVLDPGEFYALYSVVAE